MESGQQTIYKYLVERSVQGDRKAQNELYRSYAGAMYNICRRMIGNEDEAKDVLQEAFISAFTRLKTLKDANMFSAWIKRIVVNHCLNAIRKRKDFVIPIEENIEVREEQGAGDFAQVQAGKIMNAIDRLPEGARTVLNLYLFEGYDHKEISEILEITVSASKAQYSKAKSRIRKLIEPDNRE